MIIIIWRVPYSPADLVILIIINVYTRECATNVLIHYKMCLIYCRIMKNATLRMFYIKLIVISKNDYLAVLTYCSGALWHNMVVQ